MVEEIMAGIIFVEEHKGMEILEEADFREVLVILILGVEVQEVIEALEDVEVKGRMSVDIAISWGMTDQIVWEFQRIWDTNSCLNCGEQGHFSRDCP